MTLTIYKLPPLKRKMADNADNYENIVNKKAKSDVWNHFWVKFNKNTKQVVEGLAVCRHCNNEVKSSGGTTNLQTHMSRHHARQRKSSQQPTEIISPTVTPSIPTFNNRQQTLHGMFQSKYQFHSDRAMKLTTAVANYIIEDLRPLSVVEGTGFKNMVNLLDPRYTLPRRTYFSQTLIPKMYNEAASKVKESISKAESVALTTDGWTSRATESYVTITSVHVTPGWKLQNFVLQTRAMPESHTGLHIAEVIKEAIEEWGIPNNPPLVTDNAANMVVAARELKSDPYFGCFAHCLNLAAQKALKVGTVTRILNRVRKIVSFFHRSTTAAAALTNKMELLGQRKLKLIHDVPTRWNSAADMLERYLMLQPAIFATLSSKDFQKKESDLSILNEKDSSLAENIMEVLVPLRQITVAICTEQTPTVSIIIPLLRKLKHILEVDENDTLIKQQMKEAVSDNIDTRYYVCINIYNCIKSILKNV